MNAFQHRLVACLAATLASFVQAQTVWHTAVDGVWSNSLAWSAGVPNGNEAALTAFTASYTVSIDAPPTTPCSDLSISNAVGRTTGLNVLAGPFCASNGVLKFGRGAVVSVKNGATMKYAGACSTYPFVELKDGSLWLIEGGTVDFSELATPSGSGRSYIYIGNSSTGKLHIASGLFSFSGLQNQSGTNTTLLLGIGTGSKGCGYFDMTGGTAVISCYQSGGNVPFSVGKGSSSKGLVSLSNDARLIVSNWLQLGETSSTGCLTVADHAVLQFTGRMKLGCATNALGMLTVSGSGTIDASQGDAGIYIGGYDDNGRGGVGMLNILGGRARTGAGVTLCRSRSVSSGYAEANLSGGEWALGEGKSYGLTVGIGDTATAGGLARARVNIAGGLLDLSRAMYNDANWLQGFIVGHVAVTGKCPPSAVGEVFISGGTVTNSGQFAIGAGVGGTGSVYQTGGTVRQGVGRSGVSCFPMTLGWGGGCGTYHLAGGTFESSKPVFIGGVTADALGYTPTTPSVSSNGVGTLRIDDGSFSVINANLYVGCYGSGRLVIGTNGTCTAIDLVLPSGATSSLRFEFGQTGVGTLTASGTLEIGPEAELEVDTSAYNGSAPHYRLIGCAARSGSFAPENISVIGPGTVCQDKDDDIWICFSDNPATNYVSVSGSDENDGSADRPWASISHALARTTFAGDTVCLSPGTHTVHRVNEAGIRLAPGINLIGAGRNETVIMLNELTTNHVSRILDLSSWPTLANGNQTVSHLTVDGCNEDAEVGIRCYYRHNVTFHDIGVRNCYRQGLYIAGAPANTVWPAQPPDSVYCTNILVSSSWIANNGLWSTNLNWAYGGLELHQVKDSEVVNCLLDERVKGGWPVKGEWVKNMAIHNCDAWVCPYYIKAQRDFSMELFYMIGCELFDNRCNGSFSMPLNSDSRIHHNEVRSGSGGKPSYCVEWGGFNSVVDHNYFEGMGCGIGAWSWGTNLCVAHNVMRGCTNAVMFLGAFSTTGSGYSDIRIFNNTLDRCGDLWNGGPITFRSQTNVFLSQIDIRNNLIANSLSARAAVCLTGINGGSLFANYVTNTLVANNLFFNNPNGGVYNNGTLDLRITTNLFADPLLPSSGAVPAPYYECGSNSPCAQAGADVGLPFLQSAPDIGAYVRSVGERSEAEMTFSSASDAGDFPISIGAHALASFKAILLPDVGDAIRLHFRIEKKGLYRIRVRVRAGDLDEPTRHIETGYLFSLVREPLHLAFQEGSLTEVAPSDGCSWGTLQGEALLSEGLYHIRIEAANPNVMIDYLLVEWLAPFRGTIWRVR